MATNSKEKQKEYDKKRAGKRGRNFNFLVYPDDAVSDWVERLDETHLRWIEGPLHDRDVWSDTDEAENPEHKKGEFKKAHKHCMLMCDGIKSIEQATNILRGVFGVNEETGTMTGCAFPELTADRSATVRYMAHMDNPTKAQYDISDIIGHNGADPTDIIKFNMSEVLQKMVEMEHFIEDNQISCPHVFAQRIRDEHRDWYQIYVTKNTYYFNAILKSHAEAKKEAQALQEALEEGRAYLDEETGEIKYKKGGRKNG